MQRIVKCRHGVLIVDILDNQPIGVLWQLQANGYVVSKEMAGLSPGKRCAS